MNALELFSGTQSVGKVLKQKGYNVVSVDITDYNGKYCPTHKVNILDFDYTQYPVGHFDIIHASPPCIAYSILTNSNLGRKVRGSIFTKERQEQDRLTADIIVKKTLEIIDYFKPRIWTLENPATGQLKNREFMKDINFYTVDYCKYADWGYRKTTNFWTNIKDFKPKRCNKSCGQMVGNKHNVRMADRSIPDVSVMDRYRIPPKLLEELFF